MAKKVKRKLEEEEEYKSFQFPEFDEEAFFEKEYEQGRAVWLAIAFAVLLGVGAYLLSLGFYSLGLPQGLSAAVALPLLILTLFLLRRLRPQAKSYARGDWASLIMLEVFGWLGIWFLLLNLLPFK